nr:adenosylcobinamide amidohydrolase [Deinobacterium chartae]
MPRPVISSAPFGGGMSERRYLVNRSVPPTFCPPDLEVAALAELAALNLPADQTVCAFTAVDVFRFGEGVALERGVRAAAFVTAGLGNLAAPGLSALAPVRPGTINAFVLLEADLPPAALVETVQVITEVKARLLAGRSTREGFPGTGTSTDTVTVALLPGRFERYAGAVTPVGRAVARAFSTALTQALGAPEESHEPRTAH